MKLNLDRYNDRVQEWGQKIRLEIISKAQGMGVEHRPDSPSKGPSIPKIKDRYRRREDAIASVSLGFRRSLVWTHKGAGKGRAGTMGSTWLNKFNVVKKTNPKSFGKMGTGGRKEKPFFNQVLESPGGVDELATIAADELGDAIVNNILIQ